MDSESPIRVVVTPSQSAFFAGEPFSVKVTFTNTRSTPEAAGGSSKPGSQTHKRASHSISSAPLAPLPTSPGTPRSGLVATNKPKGELPRRKYLIGKPSTPSRSLSVSVLHDSRSPLTRNAVTSSPLARTDALNLSSNHPHARKHSVLDALDYLSPTTSVPPLPYTPNSSTSSFTVALDAITEGVQSPYLSTPTLGSPTIEPVGLPPPYGYPSRPHRPAPIGLGRPRPANELILYSYAQLSGSLLLATPTDLSDHAKSLRSALLNRGVMGGGRMDITSSLNSPNPASPPLRSPKHRHTHTRSSSFSAGLLSILSPTLASSISTPNQSSAFSPRWPSNLPSGWMSSSSSSPSAFGVERDIDPEEPLPTLEIQPSMLAVDLSLAPGESRTYTYTIQLPDNLPPTFKGRSLKFSYELVIGTCRAASRGLGVGSNSISRVMKVPIRVYNNVSVRHSIRPYDLLWPVSRRKELGGTGAMVEEEATDSGKDIHNVPFLSSPISPASNTLESIKEYARSLLLSFPDNKNNPPLSVMYDVDKPNGHGVELSRSVKRAEEEREKNTEGGLSGCREAVEILTRNPKKASYDVNKDGVKVAVLTFMKSAYRLGETIVGVVELNEQSSPARVLKVSAMLESHETLPASVCPSTTTNGRHLRRSHAESHASFTLNTLRTTFSLDIPSDASPAFQICISNNTPEPSSSSGGGLAWKVRLCLLVAVAASKPSSVGAPSSLPLIRTLERDGPRGEWGSSWIATSENAPLHKWDVKVEQNRQGRRRRRHVQENRNWSQMFVSSLLGRADDNSISDDDDTTTTVEADDDYSHKHEESECGVLEKMAECGGSSTLEYDGILPDFAGGVGTGVDYLGGTEGWREVKLETVECEVPVKVFSGNTAFKALDVVFDV